MKYFVLVVLLVVGTLVSDVLSLEENDEAWKEWKEKHGKSYADDSEEAHRREIWEANLKTINDHNKEYSLGKKTFTMGTSDLSDMVRNQLNLPFKITNTHFVKT